MPRDMRTVVHTKGILHVETPLGVVNIYVGLHDRRHRRVEAVGMTPRRYVGEPKVMLTSDARFVECSHTLHTA